MTRATHAQSLEAQRHDDAQDMTDAPSFTKLVPGFEFLQGLVKNAGAALPNIGQWVAPTLNPEELGKRIEELRTVQFWLEQNARMLAATIQALEVQRMTLSTLQNMNVRMDDLRESLKVKLPSEAEGVATSAQAAREPATEPAKPQPKPARKSTRAKSPEPGTGAAVDPMQWWGALTRQFTDLAASAIKESAGDATRNLATAMVKQGVDTATQTLKKAATAQEAHQRRRLNCAAPELPSS
jgi:hypothetical protein